MATVLGDHVTESIRAEDESEWEYEYSTTETETYYLTLDFPVQNFPQRHEEIAHNTRAGYRVWYNPNFNVAHGREAERRSGGQGAPGDLDPNEDTLQTELQGGDGEAETEGPVDPGVSTRGLPDEAPKTPSNNVDPDKIQILELHSEHPLVSYRGMAFRGTWAENIGTELIFASRDDSANDNNNPPPALRHLADDLDLIAASSSRVNFAHVELKPKKKAARTTEIELQPERYKNNGGVYVHVHSDKYGVRRPQANFLEDLTTLKRKRGETDEVTITSTETANNQLLGHDFDEQMYRNRVERNRTRRTRQRVDTGSDLPR